MFDLTALTNVRYTLNDEKWLGDRHLFIWYICDLNTILLPELEIFFEKAEQKVYFSITDKHCYVHGYKYQTFRILDCFSLISSVGEVNTLVEFHHKHCCLQVQDACLDVSLLNLFNFWSFRSSLNQTYCLIC